MKTDHEIHRTALRTVEALVVRGDLFPYGTIQVGRIRGGFWVAMVEPLSLPGDEWKS